MKSKTLTAALGVVLLSTDIVLNAEYIARGEGWLSSMVAITIVTTIAAGAALPQAERAFNARQWLKAAGLIAFFALVVTYSLSVAIDRWGAFRDAATADSHQINVTATQAAAAVSDAERTVAAECGRRGPRCRAAEARLSEARERLAATPVAREALDGMSARLAALTGLSDRTIRLLQPLALPIALQIGAFVFLAIGFAPEKRRKATPRKAKAKKTVKSLNTKQVKNLVHLIKGSALH